MARILNKIKLYGWVSVIVCVIAEMFLFPSLENAYGCIMTIVSWALFSNFGLKIELIRKHVFSWLVFLSMSLYRILPLFATIFEGKPVSYLFERPFDTFIGETLLYIVSCLAFRIALSYSESHNMMRPFFKRIGFYKSLDETTIWTIGIIGLIIRLYLFTVSFGFGEAGKALMFFSFFIYSPIVLLFPILYMDRTSTIFEYKRSVIIYILFITMLSFAANSRHQMIEPLGSCLLLFMLANVKSYFVYGKMMVLKRKYYLVSLSLIFIIIPLLSDISLVMLANRSMKMVTNNSASEILIKTVSDLMDREKIAGYRMAMEKTSAGVKDYYEGWDENYVDNFALNRYCNMRITDQTLYHAQNIGYGNQQMKEDLSNKILALIPTPLLPFFGAKLDKSDLFFSRGDTLYSLSSNTNGMGGFRVTSHLADALATFGYWGYLYLFLAFLLEFLLVEHFVNFDKNNVIYSMLAITTIFSMIALFRNANGIVGEIGYILRIFWQNVFVYIITIKAVLFLKSK